VYNLPTLQNALRFDADLLADIFAGRVRRWDDPAVADRNPGVELPATPIHVVHRVSGSGTSRAFATFLASSRHGWPAGEEAWRTGEAAEGNEGVAAAVQQATGAIGYVELAYATLGRLQVGLVRNARGEDVLPSDASVRGAMEAFDPATLKAALVLSPEPHAYPVAAVTWLVVDPGAIAPDHVARVLGFITWALHDGASAAAALEYVPLPPRVVAHYDSVLTEARLNPCQPAGRPTRP
jgi:phosphate transport system substrate-binding protein